MAAGAEDPELSRRQSGRRLPAATKQAGRHWLADDCLRPGRLPAGQEILNRQIRQDVWSHKPSQ